MLTPPSLNRGDTIGIISPSRSIGKQEMEPFFKWAGENGFNLKAGRHIYDSYNQYAGTDEQRLEDMELMIRDKEVKAIIAARGGYGCGRLLEGLNITLFSEHPKWLAGFSDVTALLIAVNRIAGVETLHTWMPYSLHIFDNFDTGSMQSFLNGLTGSIIKYDVGHNPLNIKGKATGILTGGNLSVLCSIAGTPYEPRYEGTILFLEDVDEYLYHIDRMILNLELRGVFNEITGLVIGSFSKMHDNDIPFGKEAYEIIAERADKFGIPTLFDFPAGHENKNHTLIFGREVTLTVGEQKGLLEFNG